MVLLATEPATKLFEALLVASLAVFGSGHTAGSSGDGAEPRAGDELPEQSPIPFGVRRGRIEDLDGKTLAGLRGE